MCGARPRGNGTSRVSTKSLDKHFVKLFHSDCYSFRGKHYRNGCARLSRDCVDCTKEKRGCFAKAASFARSHCQRTAQRSYYCNKAYKPFYRSRAYYTRSRSARNSGQDTQKDMERSDCCRSFLQGRNSGTATGMSRHSLYRACMES